MRAHPLVRIGVALSASQRRARAFSTAPPHRSTAPPAPPRKRTATALSGGVGVAETYSWEEEQFEIEVKVPVPPGTRAKDVKFKCSSDSIDLRLGDSDGSGTTLLDGSRNTRGKICVDGTFWSIEGGADDREITVTIEKHFVPVSSAGGTQTYDTLTDFDWGGVYPNDEGEVSHRKYDEAEELDVREYTQRLGVDIDNLDMSKVGKTMFGAGLGGDAAAAATGTGAMEHGAAEEANGGKGFHFNVTKTTLDQLTKAGLAKEVVQQGDGSEYELGSDGSLSKDNAFSMLGKDISGEELREAGIVGGGSIPPLWEQGTIPVEEAPGYQSTDDSARIVDGVIESEIVESEISPKNGVLDVSRTAAERQGHDEAGERDFNVSLEGNLGAESPQESKSTEDESPDEEPPIDPIDKLTVVRLKDILRAQGLKVSGNKQALRDRLREHVNGLLLEE